MQVPRNTFPQHEHVVKKRDVTTTGDRRIFLSQQNVPDTASQPSQLGWDTINTCNYDSAT